MIDCKKCEFKTGDCGHHFKIDGLTDYNIASLTACDKYGNCMFFKHEKSNMDIAKAKHIMECEKECVLRQDTPKCNRDTCGCQCCDLIQDAYEVVEAYNIVITILDQYEQMINSILKSYEDMALINPKFYSKFEIRKADVCNYQNYCPNGVARLVEGKSDGTG